MSFDKLGTIRKYPYKIPPEIKINTIDNQVLIFYICMHQYEYLKMLMLSFYSILKNTDASKYTIKIYLDNKFSGTEEERYLKKCGAQIEYIDYFKPRYTIPFEENNNVFETCINIDCDAFALPKSGLIFSSFRKLKYPISCGMIPIADTMRANILARQFQSNNFRDKSPEEFIEQFKIFFQDNKVDVDVLESRIWNYGFLCSYKKALLQVNEYWLRAYTFVYETIRSSCDETSTMLFYLLCNSGVFDITDKIPYYVGKPSYEAKNGIVHPIIGHECQQYKKNMRLINKCT